MRRSSFFSAAAVRTRGRPSFSVLSWSFSAPDESHVLPITTYLNKRYSGRKGKEDAAWRPACGPGASSGS